MASMSPADILIVEDSPTQSEELQYILEKNGYCVFAAHNGSEALDMLRTKKPILVISDIVMPEMDGFELCRKIKGSDSLKEIPVILLTALSDPEDVLRGLECAADNFIIKPYDESYLITRVRHMLINSELRKGSKLQMGVEIYFREQKYFITSERQQILDLLMSTYETAVMKNHELKVVQEKLEALNEQLEKKVEERTAALIAEIEERKKAEARVRRQNMVLDGINRIFREALTCETEDQLGRACLSVAEEVTRSSFGMINEMGEDGLLHNVAISNPGWELCTMRDKSGHRRPLVDLKVHGLYGRVIVEGKGFFTNDPASHPDSIGIPEDHPPLNSFLGVPLIRDGKVTGMVGLGNREGGYCSDDLEAAEALTVAIVQAFIRKRDEEELRCLNDELDQRVEERTAQLAAVNRELEAFSYSVSHDLRAPLRIIDGFSKALLDDYKAKLDAQGQEYLQRVRTASRRMTLLIDDILNLSRIGRCEISLAKVDLSALAGTIAAELREREPGRRVEFAIAEGLVVRGDAGLLQAALENLLGNAWKFTAREEKGRIGFGRTDVEGRSAFFVRDNGAGFDMTYAERLFTPFQRLHSEDEFSGTGIGLALVQRIINRHGGRIWGEGKKNEGATFYFTLPV